MSHRDLQDHEFPDESDMTDEDDDGTEPCPICKKQIHPETDICPYCGNFVSMEDAPVQRPTWVVVGVIVLVGMLVITMLFEWMLR